MTEDQPDLLSLSVREFAEATASKEPTPGGGSVAGVIGAFATALGEMVLVYSKGKKSLAAHDELHDRTARRLERARAMFEQLTRDDAAAYRFYRESATAPDAPGDPERVQLALAAAVDVPREASKLALAVLEDLRELVGKASRWITGDLLAAATLAAAVPRLCDYNVRANAAQLTDRAAAEEITAASAADRTKAADLLEQIEQTAGR